MKGHKIGELAARTGIPLQTIRYYERRGLLPRPPRTPSNYRVYPPAAVHRLRFIKRSQELGFTLKEIGELLALRTDPETSCSEVRRRAEAKLRKVETKIRTLQEIGLALRGLIEECSGEGPVTECPILARMVRPESEVAEKGSDGCG